MRLKKLFLGDINCSEGEAAPWASDSTKPAEKNCSLIPRASGLAAGTYPGSASGGGQRQPGQRRHCAGSPNAAPIPLLQQRCEERAEEIGLKGPPGSSPALPPPLAESSKRECLL